MASAWVRRVELPSGTVRWRVVYRLGGREAPRLYGGSFATAREARARRDLLAGKLAAHEVPDLRTLENTASRTLSEACDRWRSSRVDVSDSTRTLHRVALNRVTPILGDRLVDGLTVDDVNELVTRLVAAGKKRETIKKSVTYLAAVLDENGRAVDNPARSKQIRFPYEERDELTPPSADHVEAVFWLLPTVHRLPLLWLDWSGARISTVETTRVGDYDEPRRRVRLRAATAKTRRALWVDLPDVLADALEASLGPREDRDPAVQLFAGCGADALRTAIGKACRAAGIPVWSPHDLRHRRVSLLHLQGRSWAEIGGFVGQRKLSVTSDIYTHVLTDEMELDYANLLAR
jgi:integrase